MSKILFGKKSPNVAIVWKSQKWLSVQMLAIWDSLALFGKLTKKNLDSFSLSSFIFYLYGIFKYNFWTRTIWKTSYEKTCKIWILNWCKTIKTKNMYNFRFFHFAKKVGRFWCLWLLHKNVTTVLPLYYIFQLKNFQEQLLLEQKKYPNKKSF